jgi:predicted small integral membrane protein
MTNLAPKIEKELLASIMDAKTEAAQHMPFVNSRWDVLYVTRLSKIALVASVAWLLSLTVINNIGDYHTHFQVVKNIMSMKSVYLHNQDSWRAITTPSLHHLFYWIIIFWQAAAAILCWSGAYRCWQAIRNHANVFHQAKSLAISGLTLILLMWIVAVLGIGGQWFLMWQSELWNMQDTAFRMFTIVGIILVFLCLPEREDYLNYL